MDFEPNLIDAQKVRVQSDLGSITTSFNLSSTAESMLEDLAEKMGMNEKSIIDLYVLSFQSHLSNPNFCQRSREIASDKSETGNGRKSRVVTRRTLHVLKQISDCLATSRDQALEVIVRFATVALKTRRSHELELLVQGYEEIQSLIRRLEDRANSISELGYSFMESPNVAGFLEEYMMQIESAIKQLRISLMPRPEITEEEFKALEDL